MSMTPMSPDEAIDSLIEHVEILKPYGDNTHFLDSFSSDLRLFHRANLGFGSPIWGADCTINIYFHKDLATMKEWKFSITLNRSALYNSTISMFRLTIENYQKVVSIAEHIQAFCETGKMTCIMIPEEEKTS
jgi:hypothetical protein